MPAELTNDLDPLPDDETLPFPLRGSIFETEKANLTLPKLELLDWNNENETQSARIRLTPTLPGQEILIGLDKAQKLSGLSALGTDLPLPKPDRSNRQWLRLRGIPEDGLEISLTWKRSPTLLSPSSEARRDFPLTSTRSAPPATSCRAARPI